MNDVLWTGAVLTLGQGGSEVLGAPSGGGGAAGTTQPAGGAPGGGAAPGGMGGMGLLFPLLMGLMIFMVVTSIFSGRKEKKRRESMLGTLKKRDRVQTVGGIIGTIVELKSDELVLKVDEGSNTRIRFARSAVQSVLKPAKSPGEAEEAAYEDDEAEELEPANR